MNVRRSAAITTTVLGLSLVAAVPVQAATATTTDVPSYCTRPLDPSRLPHTADALTAWLSACPRT